MLSLSGFSGEIPRLIPRLLPDAAAQVARNCKLVDGAIVPLRQMAPFRKLAAGNIMFYKRGTTWFEWNKIVDVAPAPVAANRLYVTGDDKPKIVVDNATVYDLAVARPANSLVASLPAEEVTASIDFDATAADVQAALEGLAAIGAGNVVCTGGPLPATAIKIKFQGLLGLRAVPTLLVDTNEITGDYSPTPSIEEIKGGSAAKDSSQSLSMSSTATGGSFTLAFNRPNPDTQESIIYAYTYVTAFDEESEPSAASNEVVRSGGMDVTLAGFEDPPSDRNYNRIRIYRSQTSAAGQTAYFFVREMVLPAPTPNWVDVVEENPIQDTCPSVNYNPPPDDLAGIIALPNGMMAGFAGKRLYFSEPWLPHAWPEKYALTTNFDIVGLGAFGSSIAVLTTGQPYVVSGIAPDAMAMEQIEVNYPCVNKRGIVDLGYSVAYPSTEGLVTISSGGAQLATRMLITREKWTKLSPETMVAGQFEGRYVASYSYSDPSGATDEGTVIIDLTGEQAFLSRVNVYLPYMFYEVGAGRLFGLAGQVAMEWDALTQPFMSMTWRSKKFVMNGDVNFGAALVDGDVLVSGYGSPTGVPAINIEDGALLVGSGESGAFGDAATENPTPFQATVFADGRAVRSFSGLNRVSRLPGNFLARTWEIEVVGERAITAIYMAFAPSELSAAGGQT